MDSRIGCASGRRVFLLIVDRIKQKFPGGQDIIVKLLFSVTAYIQGKPHFSEEKDDGSATVTDEGKCDSGVGNCVGHNGNV